MSYNDPTPRVRKITLDTSKPKGYTFDLLTYEPVSHGCSLFSNVSIRVVEVSVRSYGHHTSSTNVCFALLPSGSAPLPYLALLPYEGSESCVINANFPSANLKPQLPAMLTSLLQPQTADKSPAMLAWGIHANPANGQTITAVVTVEISLAGPGYETKPPKLLNYLNSYTVQPPVGDEEDTDDEGLGASEA